MIRVGDKLRVAPVFAKHDGGTPRYMTGRWYTSTRRAGMRCWNLRACTESPGRVSPCGTCCIRRINRRAAGNEEIPLQGAAAGGAL